MTHRLPQPGGSALIVAHPGHETLLHHWLERAQPCVFILTDGSGGAENARIDHSRRLIAAAGAACGTVFGAAPDRHWYEDLLSGDASRFEAALCGIAAECARREINAIISDPVELFNPIHDLTNALAHAVARRLEAQSGRCIQMRTYPIERPDTFASRKTSALALSAAAAARKGEAILAYRPLAREYPRYRELATRDHELLVVDSPGFAWAAALDEEPYYERFGRQRLREGRYTTLLTYADHVRPLALRLLAEAAT